MRIVIDTNVVISGVFFGGWPRTLIQAVADHRVMACASTAILDEYAEIIQEMLDRKQGRLQSDILQPFVSALKLIDVRTEVKASRDPDDDKFLSCAVDAGAVYIVSGDKDLLTIRDFMGISIITAAEFCERYLNHAKRNPGT